MIEINYTACLYFWLSHKLNHSFAKENYSPIAPYQTKLQTTAKWYKVLSEISSYPLWYPGVSQVAQAYRILQPMQETWV